MTNQPDVIVVGAGVMGCGTAYWLSKAGYKILPDYRWQEPGTPGRF